MRLFGTILLVFGVLAFVLPLFGVQHRLLDLLGTGGTRMTIALCCGVAGFALLLGGLKKGT
jgi:hypothetical protein